MSPARFSWPATRSTCRWASFESVPGAARLRSHAEILLSVQSYIEAHLGDPALGPEEIARAMFISTRYLQALLARRGTSFVREVSGARLDRARDLLVDPHGQHVSIAEIAFRCGFLDPGYFARQFRKRFGVPPSTVG